VVKSPIASSSPCSSSPSLSSPFKGNATERRQLKHTVAGRVKSMLRPAYSSGRLSKTQFKNIARAATASFVAEQGRGADLRQHLHQAVQAEVGVSLSSLLPKE
jgi:hypothetical protein